jgi:uncharacterized protein YcfJ
MKTLFTATVVALIGTAAFADEAAEDVRIFQHVKTVTTSVPVTTQTCQNVQVPIYGQVEQRGSNGQVLGGAVVGGVIGNQFGSGSGKDAMTILGAILGANSQSVQRSNQVTGYTVERQCTDTVSYETRTQDVYSHSTIRFTLNGYRYVQQFQRSDR